MAASSSDPAAVTQSGVWTQRWVHTPLCILFRPSGGDTERRVDTALARWAMRQKTEVMQMLMLSKSEAEFLPSATVIIHHIQDLQKQGTIDLLVYGFTLVGIAVL